MKRFLTFLFTLAFCPVLFPQTVKMSDFTEKTSVVGTDRVIGYDPAAGTTGSRQYQLVNIRTYMVSGLAPIASSGSASDLSTGTIPLARVVGLVNANIASGAAIDLSKLAQASATTGQVMTWNGSIWAPAASSGGGGTWGTITGTLSSQTDLQAAFDLKAPIASPTFTGTPAAPTASAGTNTTQIATTAFARELVNNTAYDATSWNGDTTHAPTKDAVRDKFESLTGGGNVSNSGTPTSGQVAEWISATQVQGVATTGSGNYVRATSPTFTTPVLGAATGTSLTFGSSVAYDATSWNGSNAVPTMDALRDKIETLGSGSVNDTVYGAGWNGDTTVAPSKNAVYDKIESMSAGSAPALNASWTTSNANFVVEGDSIGAGWTDLDDIAALTGKVNYFNVAVSGTYVGTSGGGDALNMYNSTRYTNNVRPRRPAANGGTAGITNAILLLMVGTNNNYDVATSRLASYITAAKADGFTVFVCTIYTGMGFVYSGTGAVTPTQAGYFYEFNSGIYRGDTGANYIIPIDKIFSGVDDSGIDADDLHQSGTGKTRSYNLINTVLTSDGTAYSAARNVEGFGRLPGVGGTGSNALVTHGNFGAVSHAAVTAQGHQQSTLTFNASQTWDLRSNPSAKLTLTGAITSMTPSNFTNGFYYDLLIKQNGNAVTWPTEYFRWPEGQPTASTGDLFDKYTFWSNGSYLYLDRFVGGINLNPPAEAGAIMVESFLQTGASTPGVDVHNTQADTVNVGSNTWVTDSYNSSFSRGVIRYYNANEGRGQHSNASTYDSGIADDFSIEVKVIYASTDISGIIFKTSSQSNLDNTPCMFLKWATAYNYLQLIYCDSGISDITPTVYYTGTLTDIFTNGQIIKVTCEGTTCKVYTNGTLRTTQTITSALNGNDIVGLKLNADGSVVTDFKVKDLTP